MLARGAIFTSACEVSEAAPVRIWLAAAVPQADSLSSWQTEEAMNSHGFWFPPGAAVHVTVWPLMYYLSCTELNEFHIVALWGSELNGQITRQPHALPSLQPPLSPNSQNCLLAINNSATRGCSLMIVQKISDCYVFFMCSGRVTCGKTSQCMVSCKSTPCWSFLKWVQDCTIPRGVFLWTLTSLQNWQLNISLWVSLYMAEQLD